MKLTTSNGNLDLPVDLKIAMKRHNPFISDEGDASIPITLPASTDNLNTLQHLERTDRAHPFNNKIAATLFAGPIQKNGTLVIDKVQRNGGIDCVLAIDNGDLYAESKNKTLREIFEEAGYEEEFDSVSAAAGKMQDVYEGNDTQDYKVFPVAVSKYTIDETEVYQYNNEVDNNGNLIYETRTVHEGDEEILVPEGYGLAPFLKLQKLLLRLFEALGYTVTENCFDVSPYYSQIVILHNCADCLVTGVLHYADMVPTCTLGEFLEWLLNKFHVQPIVNSDTKEVKIVRMFDILNNSNYDIDISGMVEDDWTLQLNPSRRVILVPNTPLEDTTAAAETFDKLIDKYGSYVVATEAQFDTLSGATPEFNDCLVLRKATGQFYLLERELTTGVQHPRPLGSNYFCYNRENSEETEEYTQSDVMPLMLCEDRAVCPYIGARTHRHTSFEAKEEETEQNIIVVQAHTSNNFVFTTSASTQKTIPYRATINGEYQFWFGLDNYSLYQTWWSIYNRLLLNYPVHLTGNVRYDLAKYWMLDMSKLKLADGQLLIPVLATTAVTDKGVELTEAEFMLYKRALIGARDDSPIEPTTNDLAWQITNNAGDYASDRWEELVTTLEAEHTSPPVYATVIHRGYRVELEKNIFPGMPAEEGQVMTISLQTSIKLYYRIEFENHQGGGIPAPIEDSVTYNNVTITFTLTAVSI